MLSVFPLTSSNSNKLWVLTINWGSSCQDGGIGGNILLPRKTKKKDNNQFKSNKQAELPENRTVWNSNNQGIKETFIQNGRRGGEGQMSREDLWQGARPWG